MMGLLGDSYQLCKREMLIFRANLRTNIIRSALFPLFIILLFGSIGSSVSNVPIAVVNYANNLQSAQFISALELQNYIMVQTVTNQNQALSMLNAGTVSFVVVILPNFPSTSSTSPAVEVYYSNSQFTETGTVLPLIQERAAEFTSPGSFTAKFYQPSATAGGVVETPINNSNGSYKNFLFSGVIGMVLVFSALFGVGISIITDRQGGNIKSFLITPINKSAIIFGRVLAGAAQSFFFVFIVLVIGIADGSTIAMGWVGLFWIFLLGVILSICFTSMAAVIASRMKNINAYAIISQAVGMPLWFLSGGIFPVSSLPTFVQWISVVDPMTYALDGYRWVVLQGVYPLASIVVDFSVLIIFAIVMTILAIKMFKSTVD
jgi:ABC-2 type transport system permease protein